MKTLVLLFMIPALTPAASLLFSNLGPGSSYNTSQGNPVGTDFVGDNYAQGDTFMLAGNATFTSLSIALSCGFACPDPFSVTLARDAGNQPGTALETFTVPGTSLGTLGTNNPLVVLNATGPAVALLGGTRYWVTVSSDLNDTIAWNLNSTGDPSAEASSTNGGTTWFSPSGNTPGAFAISGTVPEPGSIGLLLSSALLLLTSLPKLSRKR